MSLSDRGLSNPGSHMFQETDTRPKLASVGLPWTLWLVGGLCGQLAGALQSARTLGIQRKEPVSGKVWASWERRAWSPCRDTLLSPIMANNSVAAMLGLSCVLTKQPGFRLIRWAHEVV